MSIDYHVHALAHGEYEYSREWLEKFLERAERQGIAELGFAEHEEFIHRIEFGVVDEAIRSNRRGVQVRTGLEMDYKPGRDDEIRGIIKGQAFDFIIGSIHYIDDWAFDHPDFRDVFEQKDIDKVYERYYNLVLQAIQSRLFDILGHLDLVKIWGHRPLYRTEIDYVKPLLKDMKRTGIVVEINTAGLRKPVGEIYPSERLLAALYDANIPITFGSDAHHPNDVGKNLVEARNMAKRAGYRVCVGFKRREAFAVPIDA